MPDAPTDENFLGSSIAVVRADGSEADTPRVLTDRALFGASPDWSPDGQHIVFTQIECNPSNPWGERHLALIDADGSDLTLIPVPADADLPGDLW